MICPTDGHLSHCFDSLDCLVALQPHNLDFAASLGRSKVVTSAYSAIPSSSNPPVELPEVDDYRFPSPP